MSLSTELTIFLIFLAGAELFKVILLPSRQVLIELIDRSGRLFLVGYGPFFVQVEVPGNGH